MHVCPLMLCGPTIYANGAITKRRVVLLAHAIEMGIRHYWEKMFPVAADMNSHKGEVLLSLNWLFGEVSSLTLDICRQHSKGIWAIKSNYTAVSREQSRKDLAVNHTQQVWPKWLEKKNSSSFFWEDHQVKTHVLASNSSIIIARQKY